MTRPHGIVRVSRSMPATGLLALCALLLFVPVSSLSAPQVSAATMTRYVRATADDARTTALGTFRLRDEILPVGAGNGRLPQTVGFRFTSMQIPADALIDSVSLTLVKAGNQSQRLIVDLAFEAADNPPTFSTSSGPGTRTSTVAHSHVDNTIARNDSQRYQLGSPTILAQALQEVVSRPGWRTGNSLVMLARGPAHPAGARQSFYAFEHGAAAAARVAITYHLSSPADRSVLVGPGFSDVSPHQVVRTSSGVVYIVVPTCEYYPECGANRLVVYRADRPGTPTAFSAQDTLHEPGPDIGSSASAIDRQNRIHTLWNDRQGRVRYAMFDTVTNRWQEAVTLGNTNWTTFGQGAEGVGLALDKAGDPHAVWNVRNSSNALTIQYATSTAGMWSAAINVDDVRLAPNHHAHHPTIAFAPDETLILGWLDGTFNGATDGVIRLRERSPAGTWGASVTLADSARTHIDNGPSLLVTPDGVRHVAFINTRDEMRYWYNAGSGWRGDHQPPLQVTHNPSLGPDGAGGIYLYGHGTPQGSIDGHGDNLFRFQRPAGGPWSAWLLYATGSFDSSVGARWSQFFHFFPEELDVVYWADPYPNILYFGTDEPDFPNVHATPAHISGF